MTKLVIGCGYLGERVARYWLEQGERVSVVTRSGTRAESLREEGFHPIVADVSEPDSLKSLPETSTVLHSVGYDSQGGTPRRTVIIEGLQNVLDALSPQVERLLFVSSTGAMGGHDGNWVDEATACDPQREAGLCALEAEKLLQVHRLGRRAVILRMAGLYGDGRLPKLHDVRSGQTVAAPERAYLNLIHVDDAVQAILAAQQRGTPPDLFLVSDGHPTSHREFYSEMARQLGVAEPNFSEPEPGTRGAAAELGNKRVRNRKMLQQLNLQLEFPGFREGLASICSELRTLES